MKTIEISKIESVLNEKGMKKSDLYKKLNVSSQVYNNWKKRGLPAKRANDVAKILQLDPVKLINGEIQRISESQAIYAVTPPGISSEGWDSLPFDAKILVYTAYEAARSGSLSQEKINELTETIKKAASKNTANYNNLMEQPADDSTDQ